MKSIRQTLFIAVLCAVSATAMAQDSKRALATRLSQIQQGPDMNQMTEELTTGAAQPLVAEWAPRVDKLPKPKQDQAREQLNGELKKFTEASGKAIQSQMGKAADAALIPIYMEKFTEDELRTIVTFLESPASKKFQASSPELLQAWVQKIVEMTKPQVQKNGEAFNAAAARIVNGK